MPAPRRAVLEHIKHTGEASAETIAEAVGVTVGAVRQQLAILGAEGLVAHRDERPGPGRPRRRFCLTPAAEGLWPKRYGQLTNQLLGFFEQSDPGLVEEAFEQRRRRRVENARRRLQGKAFDDRVRELTAILDEDGYLADCQELGPGVWRIAEHNCAILDVASKYHIACGSEIAFLREALPETTIERVQHIASGGHMCAYEVCQNDQADDAARGEPET
ncbi:MAG: transcriptional regulator [Candidatus Dormibacteraeota bacterium]|nr:transcriptional regulator [Candidatus Dormibacteraeota bacterium]